jgi:hypothetical protein
LSLSHGSERPRSRFPRRLLLGDEGNSALHYVDLEAPSQNWTYRGAGRDLQLIGARRVLRSRPQGYVELDLASRGAVIRDVVIADAPGGIESARRLPNGNTVIAGNGDGGIFVWELDPANEVITWRKTFYRGIDKVRLLRLTSEGTFLFCSETSGRRIVHEAAWDRGMKSIFEVPESVPADSMVKAVRIAPHILMVSTGYAATLLRVDMARKEVVQTIGGKSQSGPDDVDRPLSPFFFSGFQILGNGDILTANWQGHGPDHNGQGYQLLQYDREGRLVWCFDQTTQPAVSSVNNVIAIDGIDTERLHDEPNGVLVPV